jgi:hypothetical protein
MAGGNGTNRSDYRETRLNRFADWLERWSITRLLSLAANFSILIGVLGFILEMQARTDNRTFHAWDILSRPACGNSGKIQAVEFLNADSRPVLLKFIPDSVWPLNIQRKLTGIDLSIDAMPKGCSIGVFLEGVNLPGAQLARANFSGAAFWQANLANADLFQANLSDVDFWGANFNKAWLKRANLTRAKLAKTDLRGANFSHAILKEVDLTDAQTEGLIVTDADLTDIWAWAGSEPSGLPDTIKLLKCDPDARAHYEIANQTGLPDGCRTSK